MSQSGAAPTDARAALGAARQRLSAAGVPDGARDAEILLRAAGGEATSRLDPEVAARFQRFVDRRAAREPVSHILGRRAFWLHDFIVTPDVLDPRPDTETLVEAARHVPFQRLLDLGTGSGCVLLSLLHMNPTATGLGTDLSEAALAVAARNAALVSVADRVTFRQSDWFETVEGQFDLIVSNPPYITAAEMQALSPEVLHEPALALSPGGDGLDAYRAITARAPAHLSAGGWLMVEIGATQAGAVTDLFARAGLAEIRAIRDLPGKDRVVIGQKLS